MYGYVYCVTDLTNEKIYIGKHKSKEFDKTYFGSGTLISNEVFLKGKNNFYVELIESANDKTQLEQLERYYIYLSNSILKEVGYNVASSSRKFMNNEIANNLRNRNIKQEIVFEKTTIEIKCYEYDFINKIAEKYGMNFSEAIRFAVSEIQKGE